MSLTTISSREFNQNISRAKKAANSGPVIITDRGRPAHVLLNIDQYQKITGTKKTLLNCWQSRALLALLLIHPALTMIFSNRRTYLDVFT